MKNWNNGQNWKIEIMDKIEKKKQWTKLKNWNNMDKTEKIGIMDTNGKNGQKWIKIKNG